MQKVIRLTRAEIVEICELYFGLDVPIKYIAKMTGRSFHTVSKVTSDYLNDLKTKYEYSEEITLQSKINRPAQASEKEWKIL